MTCNTRACVAAAIPPIDSFYICSNGTLNPCVSEDNAVLNIPEQYTEFTCVAKNYLGNTTTSRTYDPNSKFSLFYYVFIGSCVKVMGGG